MVFTPDVSFVCCRLKLYDRLNVNFIVKRGEGGWLRYWDRRQVFNLVFAWLTTTLYWWFLHNIRHCFLAIRLLLDLVDFTLTCSSAHNCSCFILLRRARVTRRARRRGREQGSIFFSVVSPTNYAADRLPLNILRAGQPESQGESQANISQM